MKNILTEIFTKLHIYTHNLLKFLLQQANNIYIVGQVLLTH